MIDLHTLVAYTDALLECGRFDDYAPNGLQVEGRRQVHRLVAGVTASQRLLEAALAQEADALLVHHGYFWKNESPRVVGMKRRRLATLLGAQLSLLAYHLPLDAHPRWGNNVQLGQRLGLRVLGPLNLPGTQGLVWHGELPQPMTAEAFSRLVAERLGRRPLRLAGGSSPIRRLAWCTGGAPHYFQAVAEASEHVRAHPGAGTGAEVGGEGAGTAVAVDAYLTGEASEPVTHIARETGVHFFAAGHHATERYGVQALAAHLAERFALEWTYVEVDNEV